MELKRQWVEWIFATLVNWQLKYVDIVQVCAHNLYILSPTWNLRPIPKTDEHLKDATDIMAEMCKWQGDTFRVDLLIDGYVTRNTFFLESTVQYVGLQVGRVR
jgi:predicted  nucleic acid-binding Zn ribbon protein